jgi:hypothetical protein
MKKIIVGILLAGMSFFAVADVSESDLADLKGYTIMGAWDVTGWYDPDDKTESGTSFKGCKRNRVLILDNRFEITCDEYSYSYAYRPKAIILSNGSSFKMIVEGHVYSVKK